MAVYHRTRRLQIYGDKPEVTTLFGNRYQMVVRCEAKHDTEAWYNANKSQIFADFGTLYDAEMAIDGIEPRTGEAYDNMVLVSNEASYTRTGEYVVTFVYQTLTADFVQEAADKVDYELNGLRRVTRPLIAKDGSDYYNVPDAMVVEDAGTNGANGVYLRNGDLNGKPLYGTNSDDGIFSGASSIIWVVAIGGSELYLGSEDVATPDLVTAWSIDSGDAPAPTVRRATWADIEAAEIDPSTVPVLAGAEKVVGTSTISHAEHGYDTETLTLASAVEDAKGPNEGGYVRIVETWVETGTLSESEDKVGGQQAITIQAIGEVPSTPAGYSLAQTQESDVEGIPTKRYTFLKPSILSVSTPKVGGQQRVQVQAFNLSESAVVSEVSEVTANHELIDITTSDVDGIPTRSFTFEVDDFEVLSATENGLKQLTRTELSSTNFTRGTIGDDTYESLTLAGEEIDNDGIIKRRVSKWAEAGTLSESTRLVNDGVKQTTYTYLGVEGTPTGTIIARRIGSFEGFRTFEIDVLTSKDGTPLTGNAGAAKLNHEYQQLVPFTFPGVVDLVREQNHIFPSVRSPIETLVKADVLIYYQSSSDISGSDFTLDGSIGIWNPSDWCQKISTIDSFINDKGTVVPAYYNAQGIRGCRTRESITVDGDNTVEIRAYSGKYTPATLQLEETTEEENGKSVYKQVISYSYDVTRTYSRNALGVEIFRGPYSVKGTYTVLCKWDGSNWNITYSDLIEDPTRTDAVSGDTNYTYSIRANEWLETYTNVSETTSGTLFSGSGGGASPSDATWTGITVESEGSSESFSAISLPGNTGFGISGSGFWIEGRNLDNGASGKISIRGGPPNPLGKRYVLDVNIKKAFEDIDGNTTWMKQVVVADVNPVE